MVCRAACTARMGHTCMQAISQIEPAVLPSSHTKIESAFSAFDEYMDGNVLMAGFEEVEVKLTPARFVHAVRQRCAANPQRIVLPESNDHRVLAAAAAAAAKGLAEVVLLGSKEIVYQVRCACCACCVCFACCA